MTGSKKRIYNRKKGFTLAEILITIAVIGIIAVVTIPSVVANAQKEQTVVRLKKAYLTLFQAITRSEVVNGSFMSWDYTLTADKFFEKYLDGYIVLNKKKVAPKQINFYELNGNRLNLWIFQSNGHGYSFTLSDGTNVYMADSFANESAARKRLSFVFDINGDKGPNRMGKDLFMFTLSNKKGLVPFYVSDRQDMATIPLKTRDQLINGDGSGYAYECRKGSRGEWCAALIMVDGWQIKEDYPW